MGFSWHVFDGCVFVSSAHISVEWQYQRDCSASQQQTPAPRILSAAVGKQQGRRSQRPSAQKDLKV